MTYYICNNFRRFSISSKTFNMISTNISVSNRLLSDNIEDMYRCLRERQKSGKVNSPESLKQKSRFLRILLHTRIFRRSHLIEILFNLFCRRRKTARIQPIQVASNFRLLSRWQDPDNEISFATQKSEQEYKTFPSCFGTNASWRLHATRYCLTLFRYYLCS